MALDEDEQYESQLRLEKMCQKRQRHLMKSFKCDPQRQQCKPLGLDEHRDPEVNHYTCSTIDSQIPTLTNDTKGRTIRKVMGGGKFSSRRNFFRYQIPCMNFFRP